MIAAERYHVEGKGEKRWHKQGTFRTRQCGRKGDLERLKEWLRLRCAVIAVHSGCQNSFHTKDKLFPSARSIEDNCIRMTRRRVKSSEGLLGAAAEVNKTLHGAIAPPAVSHHERMLVRSSPDNHIAACTVGNRQQSC